MTATRKTHLTFAALGVLLGILAGLSFYVATVPAPTRSCSTQDANVVARAYAAHTLNAPASAIELQATGDAERLLVHAKVRGSDQRVFGPMVCSGGGWIIREAWSR